MANKQPVDYKQSDRRWASVPYNWPGGSGKTIESSGCGPTCGAMVIASIADRKLTPVESCAWSREHGYRVNGGTTNGYFKAHMAAYGIACRQLMAGSIVNKPAHPIHAEVKKYLEDGYWIVALMGRKSVAERGTWTTGGHFVLAWDYDGHWRINDPIHKSGNNKYSVGDDWTFRNEVRQYWLVDARAHNGKLEAEIVANTYAKLDDVPSWYRDTIHKLMNKGVLKGTGEAGVIDVSEDYCRVMTTLDRMGKLD